VEIVHVTRCKQTQIDFTAFFYVSLVAYCTSTLRSALFRMIIVPNLSDYLSLDLAVTAQNGYLFVASSVEESTKNITEGPITA
jgi:hypothetical protein